MMPDIQTLELVDRRWPALLNGEKTDTIRWKEGMIKPGLLKYVACGDRNTTAWVWVVSVRKMLLKDVPNEPDKQDLLKRMQKHYPAITLTTEIDFIEHLSVPETLEKYAEELP